ncbi:hypothetical protein VH570_05725 [Sphingobium sp. HT1-2]|jgi:hypothetical protein|uniref:hypothetical protein n=1 Tax=Sphingobium sp. HT1-2 TaxID=3111640 RepID=UPI003C1087C3
MTTETAEQQAPTELQAAQAQIATAATTILAGVPDHLRGLIPTTMAPADQIEWFNAAKASGAFDKPVVPSTKTPVPVVNAPAPDVSTLPVHARLAAGYTRK